MKGRQQQKNLLHKTTQLPTWPGLPGRTLDGSTALSQTWVKLGIFKRFRFDICFRFSSNGWHLGMRGREGERAVDWWGTLSKEVLT